jgi:hypothetical protein
MIAAADVRKRVRKGWSSSNERLQLHSIPSCGTEGNSQIDTMP